MKWGNCIDVVFFEKRKILHTTFNVLTHEETVCHHLELEYLV